MGGSTVRIGRLLGVPIGIQPLWLVIVGLITWSLGASYFPDADPSLSTTAAYVLGFVGALSLFACVVLHELGHAVVARRSGIQVEEIDLWLLGGVARLEGEAKAPEDELRFAAAGPAVTALIALVLGIVRIAVGAQMSAWGLALLDYELYVNVAILVLNLLPAFPLDGGRIARSLLWRRSGDRDRATAIAARAGRAFGWGFVGLGVLAFLVGQPAGLWFALIGGFLVIASVGEAQASRIAHALEGLTAGDLMSAPAVSLPATLTVAEAIASHVTDHLYGGYPVTNAAGQVIGVITLGDIRRLSADERAAMLLGTLAHGAPELLIAPTRSASDLLADSLFRRVGRGVVVDADRHPLGVVSTTDIERRMRAVGVLTGGPPTRRTSRTR